MTNHPPVPARVPLVSLWEDLSVRALGYLPPGSTIKAVSLEASGAICTIVAVVPGPWETTDEDTGEAIELPSVIVTAGLVSGFATPDTLIAELMTQLLRMTVPEVAEALGYDTDVPLKMIGPKSSAAMSADRSPPHRGHDA